MWEEDGDYIRAGQICPRFLAQRPVAECPLVRISSFKSRRSSARRTLRSPARAAPRGHRGPRQVHLIVGPPLRLGAIQEHYSRRNRW
jgi:hypothetical protein